MSSSIILILATVIYAAVHSWLALLGIKGWTRQRFGPAADRWYRLAYNLFAVFSGFPIVALLLVLPDQPLYRIPFPWVLLTALGQLAGIFIIVFGILQTDLWHFVGLRQIVEAKKPIPSVMVTNGLYGWVRHPLYTGGLLLIWLMPVMSLNFLIIFILLTIYLIVGARLEERRLIHEFGDEYREYQQRVPMLIPNIRWQKPKH